MLVLVIAFYFCIKWQFPFSYLKEAAEAAFQVKSVDDLNALLVKSANNRELTELIHSFLTQLSYRR